MAIPLPTSPARLLLLLLLTGNAAGAAAPWPSARPEWPQPPRDERLLFFVQRSMNPNTVVYAANLDGRGRLDPDNPVSAYWLKFHNDGARHELQLFERLLAYGAVSAPVAGHPGTFSVRLAAYEGRPITVARDSEGRVRATLEIGGRPARLTSVYLVLDERGLLPDVAAIELHGFASDDGTPVSERFRP